MPALTDSAGPRQLRADAQRNSAALLQAARTVFASAGVDAPAKQVADAAGVGVGTLYRRFPRRSDLVAAVFQHEVDACAAEAPALTAQYTPHEALRRWLLRFTGFVAAKHGLAAALHSGEPAFDDLPGYFLGNLVPVLSELLAAAAATGTIRGDVGAEELLRAVSKLCVPSPDIDDQESGARMVSVFIDGLRPFPA